MCSMGRVDRQRTPHSQFTLCVRRISRRASLSSYSKTRLQLCPPSHSVRCALLILAYDFTFACCIFSRPPCTANFSASLAANLFFSHMHTELYFFCHCYWFKACSISHLLVSYYIFFLHQLQTAPRKWNIIEIIVTTLVTVRFAIVRLHNKHNDRRWGRTHDTEHRESVVHGNIEMARFDERHIFIKPCNKFFAYFDRR